MRFFDILQWTVIAAIVVVFITNGPKVAQIITSFGNFWVPETAVLASGGTYVPKAA